MEAFAKLKRAVMKEPILRLLDHIKTFEIYINTLDFIIGEALVQVGHYVTLKN